MSGTLKPLWWSLFAVGGTVAAFLYPAHLLATCLLAPCGIADPPAHERLHAVVTHGVFRLYLPLLVAVPLFHAAHRIMAAFMDFGLRPYRVPVAVLLYGGAVAGTGYAVYTALAM